MKFFMRQTARNIVRHRKKSILHILIGVMTVLILDVYAGNMDSTEKQLADLPNVLEVTARISTLNGSQREGYDDPGGPYDGRAGIRVCEGPGFYRASEIWVWRVYGGGI